MRAPVVLCEPSKEDIRHASSPRRRPMELRLTSSLLIPIHSRPAKICCRINPLSSSLTREKPFCGDKDLQHVAPQGLAPFEVLHRP